ncbi:MAG: hypothetical protein ACYDA9_02055 [Terriglobia bacterium]
MAILKSHGGNLMLRSFARIVVVTLLPLFLGTSQAQTVPQRDPAAVAIVQNAVSAMGGGAAVAAVTDATVNGTITSTPGSSTKSGTLLLIDAPPEFRTEVQTDAGTSLFVSGHGQPASQRHGVVSSLMPHLALANPPFHLPAVLLLRELNNSQYSIKAEGRVTVGNTVAEKVHISLDTDSVTSLVTPQDWYFDSRTGLPLRVEHRLPDNLRPEIFTPAAEEFSDFRQVAGILVPFRMVAYEDGAQIAVIGVSTVTFNSGVTPGSFDLTTGGAQ